MKKKSILDISIKHAAWRRVPQLGAKLEKAARMTFEHLPSRFRFPFTVTLLLTSDKEIKQLNLDFRGIAKPTNVLSFPQFDPRELPKKDKRKELIALGDIAMGYQYIVVESKKDHKMLINHITHLLIHGILHLFGYDHGSDAEAKPMERLETKIMAGLDLPDPYTFQRPATSIAVKKRTARSLKKASVRF